MLLNLRQQHLFNDNKGYQRWETTIEEREINPEKLGIIVCDVWDKHWCRGANERLEAMLPSMEKFMTLMRNKGGHIIHAPSDTIDSYDQTPARKRISELSTVLPPEGEKRPDPPLPIDDTGGGCDTNNNWGGLNEKVWTSQHSSINIDQKRDVVSDRGEEIYSYICRMGISRILIMGVHTNMCILHRSFGIKQMVNWGVDISLVRDLTDAMYSPAQSPYVSHKRGTELVVDYIEKFWCSTLLGSEIN